jgi:DNA-directed RNA polymerase subunit RPC12/RpoP
VATFAARLDEQRRRGPNRQQDTCRGELREVYEDGELVGARCPECGWLVDYREKPKKQRA